MNYFISQITNTAPSIYALFPIVPANMINYSN